MKYYAIDGQVIGYHKGIPVVDRSSVKITAMKNPGVKYILIGEENKETFPFSKKSNEKNVLRVPNKNKKQSKKREISLGNNDQPKKNAYTIFCEAIRKRKEKEKRRGNNLLLTTEERKILWSEIKELINSGTIRPTIKDIQSTVNATTF